MTLAAHAVKNQNKFDEVRMIPKRESEHRKLSQVQ
jgi:hypothetical protein